jgi:hypothetical protein
MLTGKFTRRLPRLPRGSDSRPASPRAALHGPSRFSSSSQVAASKRLGGRFGPGPTVTVKFRIDTVWSPSVSRLSVFQSFPSHRVARAVTASLVLVFCRLQVSGFCASIPGRLSQAELGDNACPGLLYHRPAADSSQHCQSKAARLEWDFFFLRGNDFHCEKKFITSSIAQHTKLNCITKGDLGWRAAHAGEKSQGAWPQEKPATMQWAQKDSHSWFDSERQKEQEKWDRGKRNQKRESAWEPEEGTES